MTGHRKFVAMVGLMMLCGVVFSTSGPVRAAQPSQKPVPVLVTNTVTTQPAPIMFSRTASGSSSPDRTPNCTDVTTLPGGELVLTHVNASVTVQIEVWLSITSKGISGTGIALAEIGIPLTVGGNRGYTASVPLNLRIRGDAVSAQVGDLFHDADHPIKLCARDTYDYTVYFVYAVLSGYSL